jgi:ABC-type Fe3+ transport system permease subunit
MAKRRPVRIEYTRVVHYSSGRRVQKQQWSWWLIGAGVLAVVLLAKAPVLGVLIGGGIWWYWRERNGRRR